MQTALLSRRASLPCGSRPARGTASMPLGLQAQQPKWRQCSTSSPVVVHSTPEADTEFETEADRKKRQAEKLRAAEKFMVIGSGQATCKGCGYQYSPDKGDPDFPVPPGVRFEALPDDYNCPVCGAPKAQFESRVTVVAGFAENQKYGLGGNSMTEAQKSLLIYGSLAVFFGLFLAGYALQ